MPGSNSDLTYVMLLVAILMLLAIAVLMAATVSVKTVRAARERHYKSRRNRIEPLFEHFLFGGDSSGLHELQDLSPRSRHRYLAPLMIERLELLRGSERERVQSLARELGLVDRYRGDLSSRDRWKLARAVERLGYFGG